MDEITRQATRDQARGHLNSTIGALEAARAMLDLAVAALIEADGADNTDETQNQVSELWVELDGLIATAHATTQEWGY